MDEKLKLSAMDCRQYYQLGMVMDQEYSDSKPETPQQLENSSEENRFESELRNVNTVLQKYGLTTRLNLQDRDSILNRFEEEEDSDSCGDRRDLTQRNRNEISLISKGDIVTLSNPSLRWNNNDDDVSECGSEDVETVPHRYDPPTRLEEQNLDPSSKTGVISYSLADEIRMSLANAHHCTQLGDIRPPPPDLLLSSNLKRIVQPFNHHLSSSPSTPSSPSPKLTPDVGISPVSSASSALDDHLDWDLVMNSSGNEPVDLVVRNQPEVHPPETGYTPSSRRLIVHRVTRNFDPLDPTCGNCCTIQ